MSLLPKRLLKTLDVNRMPMFRSDHLREIERKAIRVVEFEGVFTGDDRLMPQLLHPNEATLDRLEKALLLRARHALDVRLLRDELGIDVAHHRAHRAGQRCESRLAAPQQPGVAYRAAEDAPQHVTATLVGRIDAVGQKEGDGARVVRQHAVGRARGTAVVRPADDLDRLRDDGLKEVGVEIRGDILHDRRDPLQAGTGVYGRSREHGAPTVRLLIVLHEDEVPDLQELSRFTDAQELFDAQVPAPCSPLRAPDVDEDLRTGTARSRIAHLPEVVLVAQAKDAAVRDPRDLAPELARFMV